MRYLCPIFFSSKFKTKNKNYHFCFLIRKMKKQNDTRWDFICLGDKHAKQKFSGHPIGKI